MRGAVLSRAPWRMAETRKSNAIWSKISVQLCRFGSETLAVVTGQRADTETVCKRSVWVFNDARDIPSLRQL